MADFLHGKPHFDISGLPKDFPLERMQQFILEEMVKELKLPRYIMYIKGGNVRDDKTSIIVSVFTFTCISYDTTRALHQGLKGKNIDGIPIQVSMIETIHRDTPYGLLKANNMDIKSKVVYW